MSNTHSDRLERWLGKEQVERISAQFGSFYWPVAVHGVPGNVHVMPGGDFTGEIKAGQFLSSQDGAAEVLKKLIRAINAKTRKEKALGVLADMIRCGDKRVASVGAFASIDAVIDAYTGGKGQQLIFSKTSVASNAVGNAVDLWKAAGTPGVGATGGAAAAGTAMNSATVGALGFVNLGTANTGHYLNWAATANVASNSLLLYDRLFAVAKTMNRTANEAVTGVPTRYQGTTAGAADFAGGNFCFPTVITVLPATAHNWTVCQYTPQSNSGTSSFPSIAGISSGVANGVDLSIGNWFMPLASGDTGVYKLTNMQCSTLVATGNINFVLGHSIAVNACPIANIACLDDGLYTALNLTAILDGACLSFMELPKPATTLTVYSGILRTVSE